MLSFTPAQLAMYRALNKVMETNRQYLESQTPENWEDAPEWKELILEIKIHRATQLFQQDISYSIQL